MNENVVVIIAYFLLAAWFCFMTYVHPTWKKKLIFYAFGSFILGVFASIITAYKIWLV